MARLLLKPAAPRADACRAVVREGTHYDVSICAVTYRRPRGLARLVESLARMKLPEGLAVEIVLVDNDPVGSAFRAPQRPEWAGSLPIRWLHDTRDNLSHARNRGVEAARGRWIAFLDDDECAHEDWIAAYTEIAAREAADGFFGPVLPRLEVPRESWIDLERFFAAARRPSGTELASDGAYTSNAFLRRTLLRELPFDPAFGVMIGEDSDFVVRALARGARFLWCDEARVEEFVPPERHSARFLSRRAFEGGSTWSHIEGARGGRPLARRWLGAVGRVAAAVLLLLPACLAGRTRAFAAWLRLCTQLGRIYGLTGRTLGKGGSP